MAGVPSIESTFTCRNAARRISGIATALFLFVAPFPSSAGSRTFLLLAAAAAIAYDAWRTGASPIPRPPRAVVIAGLAWIAWCIASVVWTGNRAYTLDELQRELAYGVLAFVVFHAATREVEDVRRGVKAILAGALLLGFFEWIALLLPSVPLADKYRAADGSFSTQLVLVTPLLAFVAARPPVGMGVRPAVAIGLGAALAVAGFATENRMLWVAVMAGLAGAFLAYRRIGDARFAGRARKAFGLALAVALLAFVATSLYKAAHYFPHASSTVATLAFDERPAIWASALPAVAERPLLGHGFGREIVGDRIERGLAERGSANRFRHGHNTFLDVTLELGLVGLALFATLMAVLIRSFVAAGRDAGVAIAAAGVAMTVGFLVKNITDDFFYRPSSLTFWALAGLLLGLAASSRR